LAGTVARLESTIWIGRTMQDEPFDGEIPDWDPLTTFVVSGPLLHCTRDKDPSTFRGRVMTKPAARRWVEVTYGRWEEIRHPRRWCFRVRRPDAPGGRYTPPGAQ
jgi:hypothetical protein